MLPRCFTREGALGAVLLISIRAILLWFVVPLGLLASLIFNSWRMKQGVSVKQFLGWIDINFILVLERSGLQPFFSKRTQPWTALKNASKVEHRIGVFDFF